MAYQVLARKYRPKYFEEVLGQEHITQSLQNAILKNKIGHAYLFTGTRGIGKTSIARIFAKAIRCENHDVNANPCEKCPSCLDFDTDSSLNVIEIDGASHNGVDHIRDLTQNVQYLPSSGQYRIYIIDEVHMLSQSAFNALLKTLEEPPAHVVFIFATTEPNKLLETVLSRCQRFDFKNLSKEVLAQHLKKITDLENIYFENESLLLKIADLGNGSVRDTLSLLDQVLSFTTDSTITEDILTLSLGLPKTSIINNIIISIFEGNIEKISKNYHYLLEDNVAIQTIAHSLLDSLFDIITKKTYDSSLQDRHELFWIFETLAKDTTWVLTSINPTKVFEIVLQKLGLRRTFFLSEDDETKNNKKAKNKVLEENQKDSTHNTDLQKQNDFSQISADKSLKQENQMTQEDITVKTKTEASENISAQSIVDFIHSCSITLALNLEQGNLLNDIQITNDLKSHLQQINLTWAFAPEERPFYEVVLDDDIYPKLKSYLFDFFKTVLKTESFQLKFEILMLESQEKENLKFQSIAQSKTQALLQKENQKKKDFLSRPEIQNLERTFNAKIDKIVVTSPEHEVRS